jgi:hypothetical protein
MDYLEELIRIEEKLDAANEILKPVKEIPDLVNWRGQKAVEEVRSISIGTPLVAVRRLKMRPSSEAVARAEQFVENAKTELAKLRPDLVRTPQLLEPIEVALEILR